MARGLGKEVGKVVVPACSNARLHAYVETGGNFLISTSKIVIVKYECGKM